MSAKEQLDDAKERKNLATELPIFDKTTPKVSVLNIGMMTLESAKKLVDDAVQQTDEFEDQAKQKAAFACVAYTTENPVSPTHHSTLGCPVSLRAACWFAPYSYAIGAPIIRTRKSASAFSRMARVFVSWCASPTRAGWTPTSRPQSWSLARMRSSSARVQLLEEIKR